MKLRGKEIIVHHNETFTLDFVITMRDGSPFILDESVENQYLLLSVSSSDYSYNTDNRYICNWWLSLEALPKFYSTVPYEISAFTQENLAVDGKNYVYVAMENGIKKYKYWNGSEFVDYEFRITKSFINDETKEWTDNSYIYSLTFVAGQDSYLYLQSIWKDSWGNIPEQLEDAWNIAVANDNNILSTLSYAAPIHNYSQVLTLIAPSKLTVLSDITGSL